MASPHRVIVFDILFFDIHRFDRNYLPEDCRYSQDLVMTSFAVILVSVCICISGDFSPLLNNLSIP